ncbi:molybdopterin-dependent oxidoreductase [Methylovirgula sp. 4M-Z18]|uniref:molybdopterin-dependent oxidoreductase n=1 Tax=Methylovirgula sp. 4M-Z18 TaxID=2293567 RepID=UPI000E2ED3F7|nr:molybdopterin-dependent oxidoreductase [Methylovirgula sp. 4M-Z18]RFB79929.1 oxidase [Methylovirgula sp. 4M-Z18]
MITRRQALMSAGASLLTGSKAFALDGLHLQAAQPEGAKLEAELDALPGKVPLWRLSHRPPNYETPLPYFKDAVTPNDAFFVRYHLAGIPDQIDVAQWRLKIGGDGASKPYELTFDELKSAFEPVELTAVCQCSGNRRGLMEPHVPGVQWGYGAMGNAKWKGARLKDILARAGLTDTVVEIFLDGADGPVMDATPKFQKSLPLYRALDPDTLVAYEMNGQPLPHYNGFPVRLVVPGWTATYWMKHLTTIEARTKPFDGFWMKSAYRIPSRLFPIQQRFPSQETAVNTPITEMMVNSLITSHTDLAVVKSSERLVVSGIAWDAGYGIAGVDVTQQVAQSIAEAPAQLSADGGKYGFRSWSLDLGMPKAGQIVVQARAYNSIGQAQPPKVIPNPAGYHHNAPHRITLNVV